MNGDNYVKLFIAVLCAHNTGSTKISYLTDSSTSFASESQKDLLKCSINSFACGLYGVDQWCLIRNFFISYFTILFTNSVPLSVCKYVKYPNQQIISWYKKFEILKILALLTALAFCHLDKYSTAIIIYWFPFSVISNSSITSIPYQSNNLEGGIGCSSLIYCISFFI